MTSKLDVIANQILFADPIVLALLTVSLALGIVGFALHVMLVLIKRKGR